MVLREISRGLIPEDVRWIKKGIDPVFVALARKNCEESAKVFINEVSQFKTNPDLSFINFDILEKDIDLFRKDKDNQKYFVSIMVIIKMLHEFTLSFRNKDICQ